MSLLRIFGFESRPDWLPDPATCPHPHLIPRYRNNVALEQGQAMGYRCNRCMAELLPRDLEDQRFRHRVATGSSHGDQAGEAPQPD